jgi:hypothetical protein
LILDRSLARNLPLTYKLIRLAPGSYDVFLDGVVVANLAQARDDRQVLG